MIDFKEVLRDVVESVPGTLAGIIIGKDGIILEHVTASTSGIDVELVGAEYAAMMMEVHKLASIFHFDNLKDITIVLEKITLIVHVISEEYYFILITLRGADIGKGRYRVRIGSLKLREMF
jgi:predicted regulator of Ras-like GTPase activity (Roadblock/LC7/MglB family)